MIGQIDDAYVRSQTVKSFQLALASPEPPLLTIYCIVNDLEDKNSSHLKGHKQSKKSTLLDYARTKEKMEIRLDARCKELLEVSTTHGNHVLDQSFFGDTVVSYIERSETFWMPMPMRYLGRTKTDGKSTGLFIKPLDWLFRWQ